MDKTYTDDDLTEAWLFGYRREWNAVWNENGIRYLGLVPHKSGIVNGVIFKVEHEDFEDFAISEGSGTGTLDPMYHFINVRTQIGVHEKSNLILTPDDQVLTCVTVDPSQKGSISPQYQEIINNALKARGPDFAAEFWKTTF